MKKVVFSIFFAVLSLSMLGQCSSSMSVYMPPRVEASQTKIIETFVISEVPFFFSTSSNDTSVVYAFSGEISNCNFVASFPPSKINEVKRKIQLDGLEIGLRFFKQTFHCREQWEKYFGN